MPHGLRTRLAGGAIALLAGLPFAPARAEGLPRIEVAKDKPGFVLVPSGERFIPWGFNYDRDNKGRLLEDYWEAEWPAVESHFARMKEMGANVVRIHLQFGKFMDAPDRPNERALDRLGKLIALAERVGLYIDLTGLGCYHKKDVPAWYDALSDSARWDAQAAFWKAVAGRSKDSPAIFCYDLMNEPVVSGTRREPGDWLAGAFAGKHYVQFINLEPQDRPRPEIARAWAHHLASAIRSVDPKHPITIGMVDWSLDRPGLTSGFVPATVAPELDFLCVHLYPEAGKVPEAIDVLAGFAEAGKPVVIEETFPLKCSGPEFERFLDETRKRASGWIGFYWGDTLEDLKASKEISDAIVLGWLELFRKRAATMKAGSTGP